MSLAINSSSQAQQQNKLEFPTRPELLQQIAVYEAAIQHAQAAHSTNPKLPMVYLSLGSLYKGVAMYPSAEAAIQKSMELLRTGPQSQLAEATSDLAMLHLAMGELSKAEREELDALQLREKVADQIAIAQSWNDLASIYLQQRQYKNAETFAKKAVAVFGNDPQIGPADRIRVRFTIGLALCMSHECRPAIPILKEAVELAKTTFGEDGLPVGFGNYLLGYAYWKSGDMDAAAERMQSGTARMKVDLGWGHPMYLDALKHYATFLREHGQADAALAIDRERHQAESVVDARTLTTTPGMLGLAGLR